LQKVRGAGDGTNGGVLKKIKHSGCLHSVGNDGYIRIVFRHPEAIVEVAAEFQDYGWMFFLGALLVRCKSWSYL
jgi:hypothetical protein